MDRQKLQQLLQQKNWKALEQLCSQGLNKFPEDASLLYYRALARFYQGQSENAKQDVEQALKRHPNEKNIQKLLEQIKLQDSPSQVFEKEGQVFSHLPAKSSAPQKKQFGRYQIVEELGRGGMGRVYKAYDGHLGRHVALKVIISGDSAEQKEIERFLIEAKATASLKHPNIITLYDIGVEDQSPYFTMDLVEGKPLKEYLQNNSKDIKKIIKMVSKASQGLHYAHQQGVIHRDIKPANIMITQDEEPLVMDFGLAKVADAGEVSKSGALIGSPAYMSPEQARSEKVGKATDIYALGATLYEVLTLRPPFQGASVINILQQIWEKDPISPRKLNPDVSVELEAICLKCLEKNPGKRYSNAQLLAQDLENFLANKPVVAKPYTKLDSIKKYVLRNKVMVSTSVAFLLTIAISLILLFISLKKTVTAQQKLVLKEKEAREKEEKSKKEVENALKIARINKIKAKLKEALAYITNLKLNIKELNFHQAAQIKKDALVAVKEAQSTVKTLEKSKDTETLALHCKILQQQLQQIQDYQIHPNLNQVKTTISFPPGYYAYDPLHIAERFAPMHPSWKYVPLKSKDQKNTISIFDIKKQKIIASLENAEKVAISRDNKHIACANSRGNIQLWQTSGSIKSIYLPQKNSVRGLVFSADGKSLYATTASKTFCVLINKGNKIIGVQLHEGGAYSEIGGKYFRAHFSFDDRFWITNGSGKGLATELYSKTSQRHFVPIKRFYLDSKIFSFRKGRHMLAMGTQDKIFIYDIAQKIEQSISGHKGETIGLCWSPDGRFLASLGKDHQIVVYDATFLKKIFVLSNQDPTAYSISFAPKKNQLGVWNAKNIKIYDLEPLLINKKDLKEIKSGAIDPLFGLLRRTLPALSQKYSSTTFPVLRMIHSEISPQYPSQKRFLAYRGIKTFLILWDLSNDSTMVQQHKDLRQMCFLPQKPTLISIGGGGIKVWNCLAKKELLHKEEDGNCLAQHPTRASIATGNSSPGSYSFVKVWHLSSHLKHKGQVKIPGQVQVLRFHPNKDVLVAASQLDVFLWHIDFDTHLPKYPFVLLKKLGLQDVTALTFTEGGNILAMGTESGDFFLYDWKNKKKTYTLSLNIPIRKILFRASHYALITTNSIYIHNINFYQQVKFLTKTHIYPLELYPGHYKGHVVAISEDLRLLTFMAPNLEMLLYQVR